MPSIFQISEFAKLSKTSIKTLRYYDERGILKPNKINRITNYRYYSISQLSDLCKIKTLHSAGLSIAEIQDVLDGKDAETILQKKIDSLNAELNSIQSQLSVLTLLLNGEEEKEEYSAVIKIIPEYRVLSKTGYAKNNEELFTLIPEIMSEFAAENQHANYVCFPYSFTVFPEELYTGRNILFEHYQAVEPCDEDVDGFTTLPSETVVSVLSRGHYDKAGKAYVFLLEWMGENGYEACGLTRELYLKGIWDSDSEKDWLTEIQIPIKKIGD